MAAKKKLGVAKKFYILKSNLSKAGAESSAALSTYVFASAVRSMMERSFRILQTKTEKDKK